MFLVLGARRQVRTLQERQVPKALKIQALERVWTIHSCLSENKPPLEVVELKIFRYKYSSLRYNSDGLTTKTKITRRNSQND